jgi:O-antigen ligase
MKLYVVAGAYAAWLFLINIVFYFAHGHDVGPQEASVLVGVVPMVLQMLLLGFDPVGMLRPARIMIAFFLIVLLSYLFNGADWVGVTYMVELIYLAALTILIAGCPDRRLLRTIAILYSVPTAIWLVYIDIFGKYIWGRLAAGGLESNAWGLIAVSVGCAAFAHRSRILGGACFAAACLTIYDASSRSSIVGLGIGTLLIGGRYLFDLRHRRPIGAVAVIAVLLGFAVVLSPWLRDAGSSFLVNLFKLDDPLRGINSGSTGRDELWQAALGLWWSHPWFGVGFRMHEAYLPLNLSAHNAYLAMLADTGIFGFLWYIALLLMSFFGMFRIKDPRTRHFAIAVIASYAFIGLFERRAINGANPMSLIFLATAMVILHDGAVARAHRLIARRRERWVPPPMPAARGTAAP